MADANVKERVGEAVSKGKRRIGLESPSAADAGGNVGIVRGALKAFGQGDHDAFLDALNEEVEWEAPNGKNFPGHGGHRGRDAVRERFIEEAGRTYTEFGFHPDAFLDADNDDSVVVLGRFVGEAVEGDKIDVRAVQIWEFKGNEAVTVCTIADSAAFPEVVTEDKLREWREEDEKKEREEQEAEKKAEEDKDDEPEGEGDKDDPEAKGDADDGEEKSEERDRESERADDED